MKLGAWLTTGLWAFGTLLLPPAQTTAHALLDRCDALETVDVSSWGADTARIVTSFERDAAAWIARDPADTPRRTISAALCALDTGAAVVGTTQQVQARRLFAWARSVMATLDADPRAADWHRASVAVVQHVGYWDLADAHIADARRVLHNDPYLQLAEAVALELRDWHRAGFQLDVRTRPRTDVTPAVSSSDAAAATARLAFERLRTVPDVAEEATVRLGVTMARQGDFAEARTLVDTFVTQHPTSTWATLAHLVGALSSARLDDADAAWRHVEAARTHRPTAQSVVTMWVALAVARGLDDEATAMVEAYSGAPDADPWMTYRRGIGVRWPAYRDAVREAVRR